MAEEPIVEQENTQKPEQETKPEEKDFATIMAEKDAIIADLTKKSNDFRKGMDLWRIRAKENRELGNSLTEAEVEELAEKKAEEAILKSQLGQAIKEKDELILNMSKTISELKNSLKNKPGASIADGGTGDKPDVKPEFFTKEQLEHLKERGIDPNKVIENLKKKEK